MTMPATAVLDFDPLAQSMTTRVVRANTLPTVMDRDDVLQEARLAVIELSMRHDPTKVPLLSWLYTSLPWALWRSIRTASHERRAKNAQVYSVDADTLRDIAASSIRVADEAAARVDCRAILGQVPVELRRVLWWHYADGYSAPQIARKLGITLGESEALIKRAMRAARFIAEGRAKPDDTADVETLTQALRDGSRQNGRIPGRAWVCKRTGLSELRYRRLMDRLVDDGVIVGRSPRCPGYLRTVAA